MSVFKIHRGKRITPKHKDWSKATWYCYKRIGGGRPPIHKSLPLAKTKEQAEAAERKLIEQAFNKQYGIADNTTLFREFAEGPYTQYVEQNNVNKVAKYQYISLLCDVFRSQLLCQISPQDCRNAQVRFTRKYSASSVNLIMSTASKIFTLACQEGILDRNPMQYVTRLKEPPPRNRLLTKEEWERLWQQLEIDSLLKSLVVLALNLPLRRGQLLAITPSAVNLSTGQLIAIESKGRPARPVPLNSTVTLTLQKMIEDGQLPFPLDPRKRWARALRNAKIEGFRFHDLRKEQATTLLYNGVNPEIIRQLFGHSAMKITQKYMMPGFEAMREAVNSLDVKEVEGIQ